MNIPNSEIIFSTDFYTLKNSRNICNVTREYRFVPFYILQSTKQKHTELNSSNLTLKNIR